LLQKKEVFLDNFFSKKHKASNICFAVSLKTSSLVALLLDLTSQRCKMTYFLLRFAQQSCAYFFYFCSDSKAIAT
jgi:hypothetical protein